MLDLFDSLGQAGASILRRLPPERAHDLGLALIKIGLLDLLPSPKFNSHNVDMTTSIPGVGVISHPIGLAAGFDKNAAVLRRLQKIGFSFLELGTVTPLPQPGNPRPRMFRTTSQMGLINRMGFNSDGANIVAANIRASGWTSAHIPIGINLGKNKDTSPDKALNDFLSGLNAFQSLGRYFVINISSPNTPGLRDLASQEFIKSLARSAKTYLAKVWIQLDPDMAKKDFQKLIATIAEEGFQGVILTNTHRIDFPETGGQSGHPLLSPSNLALERAWEVHKGSLATIATGGVLTGIDAFYKLALGASALQIYTAMVYRGPGCVARIYEELAMELKLRGMRSVQDAIGSYYKDE